MRTVNRENLRDITYRPMFRNHEIEKPFTDVQFPQLRFQSGNYFPSIHTGRKAANEIAAGQFVGRQNLFGGPMGWVNRDGFRMRVITNHAMKAKTTMRISIEKG